MAANSSNNTSGKSGGKQSAPSAEQVVANFQRMRQEQRSMASKAAEFEMEINEHSQLGAVSTAPAVQTALADSRQHKMRTCWTKRNSECRFKLCLVIDTLKEVDPSRKCFRLVGGVLVERTVKEVLPALENNKEQISKIVESLNTQMQAKGRELTEYRERYNIRLVGEDDKQGKADASQAKESEGGGSKGGAGVLVS
ncbi:prefoldin subunit 2-like isoform X1 [Myxocyprinus asiaticus]|uniref:prefoldin subunit 2-like isoform X1 n=1 Tax=Myxocyprinus asiaticus TaxID=70543 RepID=UPI002222767F|nr:prefoldin subunit 2-like isoform X1 [Myxocyprinus asiaticus]